VEERAELLRSWDEFFNDWTTVARAQDVTVTEEALTVELSDGRSISAPLAWYPRLLHGTPEERSNWRLIGQGNGVHWSALDEGHQRRELAGRPSVRESQRSLKRWLSQPLHLALKKESGNVLRYKGYTGRVEFDDEAGYSMVR